MSDKSFVGADVSKAWIDIAQIGARNRPPPVCRIDNTESAIQRWLGQQQQVLVGMPGHPPDA